MANTALLKPIQRAICCPCGNGKIVARGVCARCYTLRRQDVFYFGGLREAVLFRDGHRCRACGVRSRGVRSIAVHHRKPGVSALNLMIALCPGCHARVSRTRVLRREMTPLLKELWREQHPDAHEQLSFDFRKKQPQATAFDSSGLHFLKGAAG